MTATPRPSDTVHDNLRRARQHLARGLLDRAERRIGLGLCLARDAGDGHLVALCLAEQGLVDLARGRLGEAEARLRAAEALGQPTGAWSPRAEGALGEVLSLSGRHREAHDRISAALERVEDAEEEAVLLCRFGRVAAWNGDLAEATAALFDARCLHATGLAHSLAVTREIASLAEVIDEEVADRVTDGAGGAPLPRWGEAVPA